MMMRMIVKQSSVLTIQPSPALSRQVGIYKTTRHYEYSHQKFWIVDGSAGACGPRHHVI